MTHHLAHHFGVWVAIATCMFPAIAISLWAYFPAKRIPMPKTPPTEARRLVDIIGDALMVAKIVTGEISVPAPRFRPQRTLQRKQQCGSADQTASHGE